MTKNASNLVPVQKIVVRNGKAHIQVYHVSPTEASTMDVTVTFSKRSQFREYIKKLSTEQREELMEQALRAGITWKRQSEWKTDWMRCAMAIGSYIDKQGKYVVMPFSVKKEKPTRKDSEKPKVTEKKPKEQADIEGKTFNNRDEFKLFVKKLTTEQRQKIMEDAKKQGVEYKEGLKTSWMLCAMAIGKKLDNGESYTIGTRYDKTTEPKKDPETNNQIIRYDLTKLRTDLQNAGVNQKIIDRIEQEIDQFKSGRSYRMPHSVYVNKRMQVKLNLIDSKGIMTGIMFDKLGNGTYVNAVKEDKKHELILDFTKKSPKAETPKTPKINQLFDKLGLSNREDDQGNFIIGLGMKTVKNRFGYEEPAPGHLRMVSIEKKARFGDGNWIKLDSCFMDKDQLKAKHSARFDSDDKKWYIPLREFVRLTAGFKNVEISREIAPIIKAVVDKVDVDKLVNSINKDANSKGGNTNKITNESDIDISDFKMPDGMTDKNPFNPSEKFNLFDHQKKALKFALTNKKVTLGLAVGLGKTLTAIAGIREVINQGKAKRAVVIAPSSVKFNWKNEVEMFSNMKAMVIESEDVRKNPDNIWKDAENHEVIIVNYEMLRKEEIREKLKQLAPNLVIADEAHKLKNDTKQTKGFKETWKESTYSWFLTATPFPNGQPKETYNMLHHLRPDKVGSWFKDFGKKFVVWERNAFGATPVMLKNLPELKEKMSDIVFIRTHNSPDVNSSLPKERHTTFKLEMTAEQKKMYKAFKDDILSELKNMEKQGIKVTSKASAILAKIKRLEQIAIDPDMLKEDSKSIDLNKLYPKEEWAVNTTVDHLNDPENRGMVIFCDLKLPLDKVRQGLVNQGVDSSKIAYITGDVKPEERTKIQNKMKTGEVQVVLATNAAEEGVNLQHGAHTMIHLDIPWTPKNITQREGRVLRQGQVNSFASFFTPIIDGTVEDNKRGKLGSKVSVIEELLGEGSAGSSAGNVKGSEKSLTIDDIKSILGV